MAWRAGEFGFVYCREREPRKRAAEKVTKLVCFSLELVSVIVSTISILQGRARIKSGAGPGQKRKW